MWPSVRPMLSLFPAAPPGSHMFSRYVAYHYFSGNRSVRASKIALFGDEYARAIDPFGASLIKVAKVLPSENFSIDCLLEKSTLFGFYSAALPSERRDEWRKNQMAGQARLVNKFITGQSGQFLTKPHLHFCPLCVEDDEDAYGLGYWRLIHQIPGVAHCHTHNIALSGCCKRCQTPIASEANWHPPSRHCPHCGGHIFEAATVHHSPAYEKFTKLCEAVLDGTLNNLLYENRARFYARFYDSGSPMSISDDEFERLVELVLAQWEAPSLKVLGDTISAHMNQRFVRQAIIGQDHVVNPVGHLSIIAALELAEPYGLGRGRTFYSSPTNPSLSTLCRQILTANNIDPERVISTLKTLALQHGLPDKTGLMLIEGKSQTVTFRELGLCGARVGRFTKCLDELNLGEFSTIREKSAHRDPGILRFSEIVKSIKKEELREKNRNVITGILKVQRATRSRLNKIVPGAYQWCQTNDKQWLSQIIPPETAEEKRTRHRSTIHKLVKNGCATQRSVKEANFSAYHWCFKYDKVWLDNILPSVHRYKNLSIDEMRTLCRSIIMNALSVGITDRRHLPFGAMKWCRQNDRVWLDGIVARRDFRTSAA